MKAKIFIIALIGLLWLSLVVTIYSYAQQGSAGVYTQSFNIMGTKPYTKYVPVTDTSQLLTTAYDALSGTDGDWTKVKAVLITCETNDVRVSFGVAAAQGGSPKGHVLATGQSLRIPSSDMIKKTYIINKTNSSAGNLMVTVEY